MAHLWDFELLSILETSWKLDLLLDNFSYHAKTFTCRAEDFGQAPGSLTLHTSFLYVKVADNAAASAAFEAFARLGARLCSRAFTCGAGNSFINFNFQFLSVNCLCELYRYFLLKVSTYCVITRDSRLRSLPLEVKEFIELIKYFLAERLLAFILSFLELFSLLICPEGFCCLTLPPASISISITTWHCSIILSPIEIIVFFF